MIDVLTAIPALAAIYYYGLAGFVTVILGLSALKFLLVSFQFHGNEKGARILENPHGGLLDRLRSNGRLGAGIMDL